MRRFVRAHIRRPLPGLPHCLRRQSWSVLTGLALAACLGQSAQAQNPIATARSSSSPFSAFIEDAAQRFGIPATWIQAVLRAESGGDAHAVSAAGAKGLMQLMPTTWSDMRARLGLGADPFDPHDNILAGVAYLSEMRARYGSPGFLAAYNAGPARYETWLAGSGALPAETLAYVAKLTPLIGADGGGPLARPRETLFVTRAHGPPSTAPGLDRAQQATSPLQPRADGLFVAQFGPGAAQ